MVVADPAAASAERLAAAAERGGQIALTGGSTPKAAYGLAASMDADWSNAGVWFTDERCVPRDHEHSNYGMARTALLDRLGLRSPEVHRMRGEDGPKEAARRYGQEFRAVYGDGMPELDLVLLGLGSDAHIASLFPGRPEIDERDVTVVPVEMSGLAPFVPRISLSLPLINAAREIVFLVTGAEKAEAVARAHRGDPSAPAARVAPGNGSVTWIMDAAAAANLDGVQAGA
jgi:6-phosphogluconolactonase